MPNLVPVAKFRNHYDHLFRIANVDYHACANQRERIYWRLVAIRVLAEVELLDCKRATDYDRTQFRQAIEAVKGRIAQTAPSRTQGD